MEVINQKNPADAIIGKGVSMPTEAEQQEQDRRRLLNETMITTQSQVEPIKYALSVDGIGCFSIGDIHGIKAKQKQGKTTALKILAAALLKGRQFRVKSELESPRALWLDTEQNRPDVKQVLTDIAQMTGLDGDYIDAHLHVHALRCCNYGELFPLMIQAIKDYAPQVVFVDGIVEFVASFNDEAIAKSLVHDLQVLTQDYGCAIVCVLHTNKADEDHNMRGHLGTMLAQKSGTVLECRKQDRIITVVCTESRHKPTPDWSICFDDDGNIVDADEQRRQFVEQRRAEAERKRLEAVEKEKQERLEKCRQILRDKGGAVSRRQLTEILVKVLGRKRPTVASYISEWIRDRAVAEVNGVIQISSDMALPF